MRQQYKDILDTLEKDYFSDEAIKQPATIEERLIFLCGFLSAKVKNLHERVKKLEKPRE